MTEQEAISLVIEHFKRDGVDITPRKLRAYHQERHMSLGKNRNGWIVSVPLNVPASFEPNEMYVEVYEPDGEIYIPLVL